VVRAEAARRAGGPRGEAGPAALVDFLLRLHADPGAVRKIPRILVRRGGPSVSESQGLREMIECSGQEVLAAWIGRSGGVTQVTRGLAAATRRIWRPLRPGLRVAAIVPTRDEGTLLSRCAASLVTLPEHRPNVVLVDNGRRDEETLTLLASFERERRAQVLRRPGPFNFSALANSAAREVDADLLLFVNDDSEARSPEAVSALCEEAARLDGAVAGGLLLYPDGRTQHSGLGTGMGIVAGHLYKGWNARGRVSS
jgi:O-antigen biosynthesis protein